MVPPCHKLALQLAGYRSVQTVRWLISDHRRDLHHLFSNFRMSFICPGAYKRQPFCPTTPGPHSVLQLSTMCHWRRVRNTYNQCGHVFDLADEMIRCDDRYCKFSSSHPSTCVPPACTTTCWQYRQFPQQFNRFIDSVCPGCPHPGHGR